MNTYLVTTTIFTGECKNHSRILIRANSHSLASHYAIYWEAQKPEALDWSENRVVEMDGKFGYSTSSQKVKSSDVETLSQYLPILTADLSELLQSGNYIEHWHVEPLGQPRTIQEVCLAQATGLFIVGNKNGDYANYLFIKNYASPELPNGIELRKDKVQHLSNSSREQLLNEIEITAKYIESTINSVFDVTSTQINKEHCELPMSLGELYQKGLCNQLGLKYPDDLQFK